MSSFSDCFHESKPFLGAYKMAQWVKALAAEPADKSSVAWTHRAERENWLLLLQAVHTYLPHTHTNKSNFKFKNMPPLNSLSWAHTVVFGCCTTCLPRTALCHLSWHLSRTDRHSHSYLSEVTWLNMTQSGDVPVTPSMSCSALWERQGKELEKTSYLNSRIGLDFFF